LHLHASLNCKKIFKTVHIFGFSKNPGCYTSVPPNPKSWSGDLPAPPPSPTKSRPPGPKSRAGHRSAPSQIPARPVPNLPLAISYPPLPSLPNPSLPLAHLTVPPSSRSPAPTVRSRSSQLRVALVAFVAVRSRPAWSLLSAVQPLRMRFAPVEACPVSISSVCRSAAPQIPPFPSPPVAPWSKPRQSTPPPGARDGGGRAPKADRAAASLLLFLVSKPLDQLLIFVTIWCHSSSSIYIYLKNIVTPATSVRCSTNISSILRHCQDMFFPLVLLLTQMLKNWDNISMPSLFHQCL